MADAKYGRLFTEADVISIVAEVLLARGYSQQTARHDAAGALRALEQRTTFPADEPLFLLRGRDRAAADTIADYQEHALNAGHADGDDKRERLIPLLESVERAEGVMRLWQRDHPDRVKRPG